MSKIQGLRVPSDAAKQVATIDQLMHQAQRLKAEVARLEGERDMQQARGDELARLLGIEREMLVREAESSLKWLARYNRMRELFAACNAVKRHHRRKRMDALAMAAGQWARFEMQAAWARAWKRAAKVNRRAFKDANMALADEVGGLE